MGPGATWSKEKQKHLYFNWHTLEKMVLGSRVRGDAGVIRPQLYRYRGRAFIDKTQTVQDGNKVCCKNSREHTYPGENRVSLLSSSSRKFKKGGGRGSFKGEKD